jgi:hypothetical protein
MSEADILIKVKNTVPWETGISVQRFRMRLESLLAGRKSGTNKALSRLLKHSPAGGTGVVAAVCDSNLLETGGHLSPKSNRPCGSTVCRCPLKWQAFPCTMLRESTGIWTARQSSHCAPCLVCLGVRVASKQSSADRLGLRNCGELSWLRRDTDLAALRGQSIVQPDGAVLGTRDLAGCDCRGTPLAGWGGYG